MVMTRPHVKDQQDDLNKGNNKQCHHVEIIESNLFDIRADAYLISIGENCKLKGAIAKHIKENFSDRIEKRLKKAIPLPKGECILIQDQGNNFIFGMPFDYELPQLTIAGVEMILARALEICDANQIKSIAVPTIATNHMPEYSHSINHIIHLGIKDYFTRNPASNIKKIYLVNYKREVFTPLELTEPEKNEEKTIYLDIDDDFDGLLEIPGL